MLRNITEMLVEEKLDELLSKDDDCCKCPQCREDIIAYTLNQLKPHYVSSSKGELYSKAKMLSINYEVEITAAVARAIKTVTENPRH